ncbi:hypothetical protein EIM48_11140 [Pseudoxanthomonas sp. SGNA-20]|nr:hypothetical protein EIM48_11140 [Pseudoxanthomonas sp. SGNA-20]
MPAAMARARRSRPGTEHAGSSRGNDAMAHDSQRRQPAPCRGGSDVHTTALRIRAGKVSLRASACISTRGLLAVTGLVVGTLLSSAAIVAVATRKLPQGTMPARSRRSRG